MKKTTLRILLLIMVIVITTFSFVSCDDEIIPDTPLPDGEKIVDPTNEEVRIILEQAAVAFLGSDEFKALEITRSSGMKPFLTMDQSLFVELDSRDLEDNEILNDALTMFQDTFVTAYSVVKYSDNFKLGKIYSVDFENSDGTIIEETLPTVCILSAGDGGIYILRYENSVINNEKAQITYYLNLVNNRPVMSVSAIYSGKDADGNGCVIVDNLQIISLKSVETASVVFSLSDVSVAHEVALKLNANPNAFSEIRAHVKTLDYEYATLKNNEWISNGVEYENKTSWSVLMNKIYETVTSNVDIYGADFEAVFANDVKNIVITEEDLIEKETAESLN